MQDGRVIRNPAEWRYEYDDQEVFHGEWIELEAKTRTVLMLEKVQDGVTINVYSSLTIMTGDKSYRGKKS